MPHLSPISPKKLFRLLKKEGFDELLLCHYMEIKILEWGFYIKF